MGRAGRISCGSCSRCSHVSKRFGATVALDDVSLWYGRARSSASSARTDPARPRRCASVMGLISVDAGDDHAGRVDRSRPTSGTGSGTCPPSAACTRRCGARATRLLRPPRRPAAHRRPNAAADEWLERVGLTDRADDEVQALSSGNQQRVQLAIALVHDPELLILDEPFSGTRPARRRDDEDDALDQVRAASPSCSAATSSTS